MKKPQPTFELVKSADAETEKRIAGYVKAARFAIVGNRRARNLFFAYAAVGGACAEAIMQLAPHGQGEKLLERHFGKDVRTLLNWRKFSKEIVPKLKSETVSLLTAPTIGKKTIASKDAEAIQEAVFEVMDGQGMIEFLQYCKALRTPKIKGGDRTLDDKDQIKQWCKEYHPDMPAEKCELLPGPLKKEFRKWAANQNVTVDYDYLAKLHIESLAGLIGETPAANACAMATLKDWIEASESLTRMLKEAFSQRKQN